MNFFKYIYIAISLLVLNTSCGGFLDVNEDPVNPTEVTISQLLTGAQRETGYSFAPGSYIGGILPSYVFHTTSKEVDNYSISSSYASLGNTWQQGYLMSLRNIEDLIVESDAKGYAIYGGIGRLMRAYMFSNLVELWGDVPYTEFYVENNFQPKLDTDKDIYNDLFKLIDKAIADLSNTDLSLNSKKPAADDIFYEGDVKLWIKMANTLKLKLLVQSRKAKSDIEAWDSKLSTLLTQNNFLKKGEDFQLRHTAKDSGPDERHPAYAANYSNSVLMNISPWLYETMMGKTYNVKTNLFKDISDPRVPYYWYRQIKENTKTSVIDYREAGFASIFFASASSAATSNQSANVAVVGIYPCGGKYDDGSGKRALIKNSDGTQSGSGGAPEKMLQTYSIPFLLAELYLTGNASGDAKAMLEEGIRASITHVNSVSQSANSMAPNKQTDMPDLITNVAAIAAVNSFVTSILAVYDAAATNEEKLNVVMTQKWIANFFNPIEAYSDMRRTGFPKVPDATVRQAISPFSQTGAASLTLDIFDLKAINAFPRAMWYPNSETSNNPNVSNTGRDLSKPILFWDK